jgi:hypothetical protein
LIEGLLIAPMSGDRLPEPVPGERTTRPFLLDVTARDNPLFRPVLDAIESKPVGPDRPGDRAPVSARISTPNSETDVEIVVHAKFGYLPSMVELLDLNRAWEIDSAELPRLPIYLVSLRFK